MAFLPLQKPWSLVQLLEHIGTPGAVPPKAPGNRINPHNLI